MAVRVTLSLDEDLAAEIQKAADRSGRSFEQAVNDSLRLSIRTSPASVPPGPFEVRAKALYARPGINFDDIEELLEQAEGPAYR
jgi:Ribbon-helix-helix protein, copG family